MPRPQSLTSPVPDGALARWLVVSVLALVGGLGLLQPRAAEAQTTGGSFGGGSFGGGGGSHGGGGGSHSYGGGGSGGGGGGSHSYGGGGSGGGGGGSHSYGGSSPSYGGSGTSDGTGSSSRRNPAVDYRDSSMKGSDAFALGLALFVVMLVVVVRLSSPKTRAHKYDNFQRRDDTLTSSLLVTHAPLVDVSAIQLALDWRARPALQKRLEELARGGQTSTPGGLAHLLHETVVELRRAEASWLYSGAVNALPTQAARAETQFRQIASEARTRFKVETVRVIDGRAASAAAPSMRARADEGAGLVVVTLVVAATREIPDIARATDAHQLRNLLRELGSLNARDMVALEVIWSPSAENDRLSSAELEALYPELHRVDESTVLGRVFCGYCTAPFPAELLRCPSCGAPGTEAKRASV